MYLVFLRLAVFGYSSQALTFFGLPRATNLAFLFFSALLFLSKSRKIQVNSSLLVFFLFIGTGSFLYSESWIDVYVLLAKILTSIMVAFVAYHVGKEKKALSAFFVGIFFLLLLDSLLRLLCYGPIGIIVLLDGPLAYKTECTIPFHDSNASGIVAVLLLSIMHLIFIFRPVTIKLKFFLCSLITAIAILTASKAAVVCCLVYVVLAMIEKFISSKIVRVLLFLAVVAIGILVVTLTINQDASFSTKYVFLNLLLNSLVNDPVSLLFGHGYYTGQNVLAGESEFSHILPSLMLGTFGLIGSIGYTGFVVWSYHTGLRSLIPIILFSLLGLSYFPPLFDYFVFLIAVYAGLYRRYLEEFYREKKILHSN